MAGPRSFRDVVGSLSSDSSTTSADSWPTPRSARSPSVPRRSGDENPVNDRLVLFSGFKEIQLAAAIKEFWLATVVK
eukprot:11203185-Lingulodinium_polyedra.AAC.1